MSLLSAINKSRSNGGCKLMEDRLLAELPVGNTIKIIDFAFIEAKNGNTLVFVAEDHDNVFYFGNSILKDFFVDISEDETALNEFRDDGLAIKIEKKAVASKSKREYYPITFLYEDQKKGLVKYSTYEDVIKDRREDEEVPFNNERGGEK